jgi:hypothetical protein
MAGRTAGDDDDDDGRGSGSFAVEPAGDRDRERDGGETPATRRRLHRWLTCPSGAVVFACLFLPAVRVCNAPAYPYEVIGVQTPYVLGLLAALVAAARSRRVVAALVIAIRGLVWVTNLGWAVALVVVAVSDGEPVPLLAWLAVTGVLIALFGWRGTDERAAARVTIAAGVSALVWFGIFLFDPGAMYGTYTGAVAASVLLIGGLEWRRQVIRDP